VRGKGEGGFSRIPADPKQPLKYWEASIELPPLNGVRRTKKIRRKSKTELVKEVEKLRAQLRRRGDLPTTVPTVEDWFRYWLANIGRRHLAPNTYNNYAGVARLWIIPTIGNIKLSKVTPEVIRRVTDAMEDAGKSGTYRLNAHRIMSSVFEDAVREAKLEYNPAKVMRAPRKSTGEQGALEVAESVRLLRRVSQDSDYGARWATGLLTGARRGEVIGLELDRVGDELDLSWQLQRIIWAHGCQFAGVKDGKEVWECGTKRGADCPARALKLPEDYEHRHITEGLYWVRPKSKAGWRVIPLVEPLRSILERHIALAPPNPYGLVFTRPDGHPIDPKEDSKRWQTVLDDLGINRRIVQHGIRHTTVDLMFAAKVPEDLIEQIVGHSVRATTRGYKTRGQVNQTRASNAMLALSELLTQSGGAVA
jgi:integrase